MLKDFRSLKDYFARSDMCIQRKFCDYSIVLITHLGGVNLEETTHYRQKLSRMFSISIILTLSMVQAAMLNSQSNEH